MRFLVYELRSPAKVRLMYYRLKTKNYLCENILNANIFSTRDRISILCQCNVPIFAERALKYNTIQRLTIEFI